jgi:hypothetical protein
MAESGDSTCLKIDFAKAHDLIIWSRAHVREDHCRAREIVHQYYSVQDEFVLLHLIPPSIRGLPWEFVPSGYGQRQAIALCLPFAPEVVVCLEAMAGKDGLKGSIIKESDEQRIFWFG